MAVAASQDGSARVLVVEDDGPLRAALVFDLEAQGFVVAAFASGEEALASQIAADCLVVDLALPGLDGLILIERLQERGLAAPAILVTTDPDSSCRARAAVLNAEIIEKPLIGRRLNDRIAELVGG